MIIARREILTGRLLLLLLVALTILPFLSLLSASLHPSDSTPLGIEWPTDPQWSNFVDAVTNKQTLASLRLTVFTSIGVTMLNMVMGTIIAWVLVRDRFWGKGILDVLIDLPFALPTIVAGLVLLSLYGPTSPVGVHASNTRLAVFLAIAFVTLPFVVRTVQPVLEEMERDVEDAAASLGASRFTTFRRVTLPTLVPAIFAGASLSFARGISEYGSLVLLSGNLPYRTEVTSVRMLSYLEGGDTASAAAVATILLVVASGRPSATGCRASPRRSTTPTWCTRSS